MKTDDEGERRGEKASAAPRIQIKVADDVSRGAYSNVAFVHHNDSDFVLDFVFVEPGRPQGHVVSRVVTNPRAAKRLAAVLQEAIRRYEERAGKIEVPDAGAAPQGSYH